MAQFLQAPHLQKTLLTLASAPDEIPWSQVIDFMCMLFKSHCAEFGSGHLDQIDTEIPASNAVRFSCCMCFHYGYQIIRLSLLLVTSCEQ